MSGRAIISGLLLRVSNGRIVTRTARRVLAERRKAWQEHCVKMQYELDIERINGKLLTGGVDPAKIRRR